MRWNRRLFFIYIIFLLVITVFPFDFRLSEVAVKFDFGWRYFVTGTSPRLVSLIFDIIANIVVFIPFGALYAISFSDKWSKKRDRVTHAARLGFAISLSVEIAQFFLPFRFPSILDLLTNTAGTAIGGLIPLAVTNRLTGYGIRDFVSNRFSTARIAIWTVVGLMYFAGWTMVSVNWVNQVNFTNWDENYTLSIGNEATENRPWRGDIRDLHVFDTAFSGAAVRDFFRNRDANKSPIIALDFRKLTAESVLSAGWRLRFPDSLQFTESGLRLNGGWLTGDAEKQKLLTSLRKSNAFTIVVRLDSFSLNQHGPARILSFAPDVYSCNFMLGQNFRYLCFRLQTPHSGTNGDNPIVWQSHFFEKNQPLEIAVTFDGNHLSVFKNGEQSASEMKFAPEAAFFRQFFQIQASRFSIFERLFYWMVFLPVGILFVPLLRWLLKNAHRPHLPLPIILLVPVATFFVAMQQFAGLSIEWHNVIVAILAVLVGGTGFFIPANRQI